MTTRFTWRAVALVSTLALLAGFLVAMIASPARAAEGHSLPADACTDDRIVTDHEAYDEIVVDKAAVDIWHTWTGSQSDTHPFPDVAPADNWNPDSGNHNGQPFQGHVNEAFQVAQGDNAAWFYHEVVAEQSHLEHHDAVTHVEPGTCDIWVTWKSPVYHADLQGHVGAPSDIWNQTFVSFDKTSPDSCTTYQQDRYQGSREDIEAVLSDGILTGPSPYEDGGIVTDWTFVSTEGCPEPTPPVAVQFNVPITEATCTDPEQFAGTFPLDREGFTITVDRVYNGPGVYTLTATTDEGLTFEGGGTTRTLDVPLTGVVTDAVLCPTPVDEPTDEPEPPVVVTPTPAPEDEDTPPAPRARVVTAEPTFTG
jgi:hypothetical protein